MTGLTAPFRAGLLLVVPVLASCAGGGDAGQADWLTASPDPVRLTLELDHENATSKTITPAGGTVAATGEDGSYYELRIPRNALDRPVRVTMTPVRAVKGEPLERRTAAAVQLQPDGLRLLELATLTIETEREIPAEQQVAFAYLGDGEDAHLYPLGSDPEKLELELAHFSGYGVGYMPPADPGRQALQRAAAEEARLEARMAQIRDAERARQLVGDPDGNEGGNEEFYAASDAVFAEYVDGVLLPLIREAAADFRLAKCAWARYLAVWRQMELLGMREQNDGEGASGQPSSRAAERLAEAQRLLDQVMRGAEQKMWKDAVRRCRDEHQFDALHELVGLARKHALLGDDVAASADLPQLVKDAEACWSFELQFDSYFENRAPHGAGFVYQVRSTVDVTARLRTLTGDTTIDRAPLEYARFSAWGNPGKAMFGNGGGKSNEQRLARGLALGLASGQMSAAGTRQGELAVIGIERHTTEDTVIVTDCKGKDAKEKQTVRDSFTVTLAIRKPTEIINNEPDHAPAFTDENHNWMGHWEHARRDEQPSGIEFLRNPEDEEELVYTTLLLKPTGTRGEWEVRYATREGALGFSLAERSRITLRHTPK